MRTVAPKLSKTSSEKSATSRPPRVEQRPSLTQVMRMPQPQLQVRRACACGGGCPACRDEKLHAHGQTKRVQAADSGTATAPAVAQEALPSPGQPLDAATHAFMEPHFGRDFSGAPLQADARAGDASRDACARPPGGLSPTRGSAPAGIQAKLTVNTPGDAYEQEADHVADQVMRMAEPGHSSPSDAARRPGGEHEHRPVQIMRMQASDSGGAVAPPIVHEVLRSPGQPLDAATRAFMEPRFGRDFGDVRVHTDSRAAESAAAVRARAYTVGQDVVFGAQEYVPQSHVGRTILAHELAHTKQGLANTVARKIIVGGNETPAASLLPAVTAAVNTWYAGVLAGVTAQVPSFNAAADMPFDLAGAVARAGEILNEMEDAKYEKTTVTGGTGKKRSSVTGVSFSESKTSREDYDFTFGSQSDAVSGVLFRLSLMLNTHLAEGGNTAFARYPIAGEKGLNLQNPAAWQPVPTNTQFDPGGFQLQPGTTPSAAITQLTSPVPLEQLIVVDCATMIGILYYKSLLQTSNSAQFDKKFSNMIVGPLAARYGGGRGTPHPLRGGSIMKEVKISDLRDLVPGDTVMFANHNDYKRLAPGGLWSGEWATYTRKEGKDLYFEGFGVAENTYKYFMDEMELAYKNAWDAADQRSRPEFKKKEPSEDTIEGRRPGIIKTIYRVDLAAYNQN